MCQQLPSLHAVQSQLEAEAICIGGGRYREAYRKSIDLRTVHYQKPERKLIADCIRPLAESIEKAPLPTHGQTIIIRDILSRVHPFELAFIVLQTVINSTISRDKPPRFQKVTSEIGQMIGYQIEYVNYKKAFKQTKATTIDKLSTRARMQILSKSDVQKEWLKDAKIVNKVGAWCLARLLETPGLELVELQLIRKNKKSKNCVVLKNAAHAWIMNAHREASLMAPLFLPMVVQPANWTSAQEGGYLSNAGPYRLDAIRGKHGHQTEQTGAILCVLNALQKTPYRINHKVLDVLQQLQHNTAIDTTKPEYRLAQQLWIADKFKEYKEIFFCWYADWRGRVYPVQPYLNPQADSTGKGLLEFSKGKRLGVDGARWLAIHGANTYGKDKASFSERIAWVNDHRELIVASADNPLGNRSYCEGKAFWEQAKKPLMFLAFCFEWADYLRQGPGMVSHLPVSVDGTCSGLQHYSALLKDEECGKSVNLMQGDRPEDFYAEVARATQRTVESDTENECARLFVGQIDRAIVKRNAMTYTYGATLDGFTDQITDEWTKTHTEGDRLPWEAARYLAMVNDQSIKNIIVKAAKAMDYLQAVARVASNAGIDLSWVTPSGFKVDHRYHKPQLETIRTVCGSTKISASVITGESVEIDKTKTSTSIAPNFIHSLDASHMALTVLECTKEGMTDFMMVHDSFGCHAADMQAMNRILRQEFVKMYSNDFLSTFHEQVKRQLPPDAIERLPCLPMQGKLDIEAVNDSAYFFA